jgi:hypothetical protein
MLSKKSKHAPSSWGTYTSKQKASAVGANIADLTQFLVTYLSGEPDVNVVPVGNGFASVRRRMPTGKSMCYVYVPPWDKYDLPLKAGFDKYRIYRSGVWHEAMHLRYTPQDLWQWRDQLAQNVFNIIEDRRIEDLGVEYWQGYVPERLYSHAYGWALRPAVDKIADKRARIAEAFLQRMVVGKVKGKLDKAEADLVEQTARYVERKLKEINEFKEDYRKSAELRVVTDEVIKRLDLRDPNAPPDQNPFPNAGAKSPWEATFRPDFKPGKTPEQVEEEMDKFFKEKEEEAKDEPSDEKKDPNEITKQDIKAAREGSAEVKSEYQQATQTRPTDPAIASWIPVVSHASIQTYRDEKFIRDMDAQLRKWQTGYETIVGKTGARLSIPDYIRHQDEPFATRLKRSVMGKKLLIVADFSGSMGSRQEDYKKALISAIEVLNKVGSNISLFGFGSDPAQGEIFFRVKTFEEPKWTVRHSSKVAALEADFGSTPLGSAYRHLSTYIARHKPDITVTMTDGEPDNVSDAMQQISQLKKHTRMVAFGMGDGPDDAQDMAKKLKSLGYHKSVAVPDLRTLPPQLVKLMVPT